MSTKCVNKCGDMAEQNFTWQTSRGAMSANLCGVCAGAWWSKYSHTPAGQSLIIGPCRSHKELREICAEYENTSENEGVAA